MDTFIKTYWICLISTIILIIAGSCLLIWFLTQNYSDNPISLLATMCLTIFALLVINLGAILVIFIPFYWIITKFTDFGLFCCIATGIFVVSLHIGLLSWLFDGVFGEALPWSIGFGFIYGAVFAIIYSKLNNGFKNQSYDGV